MTPRACSTRRGWRPRRPLIVFEPIEPADARARLENAVAAGECPGKPDEVDDLTAHRALLRARVRYLATAA